MRLHHALISVPFAAAALACSGTPAAHPSNTGDSAAAPPTTAAGTLTAATADSDRSAGGNGVPAGFVGRTDESGSSINDAKYTAAANGTWDVRTGPAHILYQPAVTGHGNYTVQAEIDQVEALRHPEAYGVFIGGQSLDGAGQKYAYFLVRGDGMYAIKVRDGADARTVALHGQPGRAQSQRVGQSVVRAAGPRHGRPGAVLRERPAGSDGTDGQRADGRHRGSADQPQPPCGGDASGREVARGAPLATHRSWPPCTATCSSR